MDEFFRAYCATGTTKPTYFIESTAPNNVDDRESEILKPPAELRLVKVESEEAVKQIAKALADADDPKHPEREPNLVVMVHGFNNPAPDVLETYAAAAAAVEGDSEIRKRAGLVCVGYRWPSERMTEPFRGTWDALPTLPTWILKVGRWVFLTMVLILFPALLIFGAKLTTGWYVAGAVAVHVLTMLGWTICGLVLAIALLRLIVYFRDNYRASNYGVPDLIQIIRAIDSEIVKLRLAAGQQATRHSVQLSFIGHSMGGFVVTNAIRSLSDLFEGSVRLNSYGPRAERPSSNIGRVFRLMRFVLASPDIPAETLLANRGNFLSSALRRFDEAYLFSNEGDAVLRQISTLANYFVFPTKSQYHGFRLGNVEILSSAFGLTKVEEGKDFLDMLRIGKFTLQELYKELQDAEEKRRRAAAAGPLGPPAPPDVDLPKVFTYFDCTDYKDKDRGGKERPLLTFAKCLKVKHQDARLRWYSHQHLLWAYLFRGRPNVHGGYFEGELSQRLIYRLACLGFDGTVQAFKDVESMGAECRAKQIRVLLSPKLAARVKAAAGPVISVVQPPSRPTTAPPPEPPTEPPPQISGVPVPNVVGMSINEAREAIRAVRIVYAGFQPLPVRGPEPPLLVDDVAEKSTQPPGTVLRQTPAAGTRVARGTTVMLVIATGEGAS